jgi:hypothetical protein
MNNNGEIMCPICRGSGMLDCGIFPLCPYCRFFLFLGGKGFCLAGEDGPQPIEEIECPEAEDDEQPEEDEEEEEEE